MPKVATATQSVSELHESRPAEAAPLAAHRFTPLGFVFAILCAAWVTNQSMFPAQSAPTYSAAAGVGVICFAEADRRYWGGWFVAVVLSIFALRVLTDLSVVSSAIVALAVGCESLVFRGLLLRSALGTSALSMRRGSDILRVIGMAALASVVGGIVVGMGLQRSDGVLRFLEVGTVRALADVTGIMTIAPLVPLARELPMLGRRALLELTLAVVAVLTAMHLGFVSSGRYHVYPYLPLALLLFAVVRCGRPAAALLPALWVPLAINYTQRGFGPWMQPTPPLLAAELGVQLFNLTAFSSAWLVAALTSARDAAHAELARSNASLEARVAERTSTLETTIATLQEEITQRLLAEGNFRVLFDNARNPMLLIDAATHSIVEGNTAAVAYYGWSAEQLRGMRIDDINILSRAELESEMSKARQLRRNYFQFRHRRADGMVREVDVFSGPITLDRRPLLYSIIHDVTDAKQAELSMRKSELRFRSAFDRAPVGMVEVSFSTSDLGRFINVNQMFCDMVGYSKEELLATTLSAVSHPDDRPVGAEQLAKTAAGSLDAFEHQCRYLRKDGRVLWAKIAASVLLDDHNQRYGLVHVLDVTKEKESQELMDLVFEVCIDPLGIIGFDGYFRRMNPAWERSLGWSRQELMKTHYLEFVHSEDRDRTEDAMRALKAGSQVLGFEHRYRNRSGSYSWLQWNLAPLPQRSLVVTNVRDITFRKEAEVELARRALHDVLTGLPNRQLFKDRLTQSIRKLDRRPGSVALYFVDLDHFKEINDSFGHETGDHVLLEVARRLSATVRTVDTVARLAGDEFVVVCPDMKGSENLSQLAERLLAALAKPLELPGQSIRFTASIGLAVTESAATTPEQLMHKADMAMYEVKRQGRHGWQLYNSALEQHARHRSTIHQELRDALEQDALRLYYQPVIDLASGRIVGTEALVRLEHPTRGLLAAHEFIAFAEESDIILGIDAWVLEHACRQAVAWNSRFGAFDMAVNMSGRQAGRCKLAEQVFAQLTSSTLEPARLCIELTERVLIDSGSALLGDLHEINRLGVHVALDDFGTGYSSLTYLKRFPIDTVKIDASFVADLGNDQRDNAIVRAITGLASSMRLVSVAEGVEDTRQLDELRGLNCQRAQGFLFSHAVPAEQLTQLLELEASRQAAAVPATG